MKTGTMSMLIAAGFTAFGSANVRAQLTATPTPMEPSARIPSWSELENAEGERVRKDLPTRDYDYDYERQRHRRDRQPTTADGRELDMTRQESRSVAAINEAISDKEYDKARAHVAAGLETASSADAQYAFAALLLRIGYETRDEALQDQAVDAATASGAAPLSILPSLYRHQGISALKNADYARAEMALTKLTELAPEDAEAAMLLAATKNRAKKPAEALRLFQRAVELKKAADQPIPPEWTRVIDALAATLEPQTPG